MTDKISPGTLLTAVISTLVITAISFIINMSETYVPRREYDKDRNSLSKRVEDLQEQNSKSFKEIKTDTKSGFKEVQRMIREIGK